MGDPLLAYYQRIHRALDQQGVEMHLAIERLVGPGAIGSPSSSDYRKILSSVRAEDRRLLWSKMLINTLHMTINVVDHLRSGALLISQPEVGIPAYAHASIARVTIESATRVAYFLDKSASFDVRFARGVAAVLDNADLERKTANDIPANAYMTKPGPKIEAWYTRLLAALEKAKIEVIPSGKIKVHKVRVTPGGAEVLVGLNMTDEIKLRFPHLPGAYRLTSGVTHGSPYMLDDSASYDGRRGIWQAEPLSVGSSVLIMLNAAQATLAAHAWHRGLENDPSISTCAARITEVDLAMKRLVQQTGINKNWRPVLPSP